MQAFLTAGRDWVTARRRILGDGVWVAIGQVGSALGALMGTRLLTEFLPPHVFGEVTLLVGITTLGYGLAGLPFVQAALRFYPDCARTDSLGSLRKTTLALLQRSGMWLCVLWIAGLCAYNVFASDAIWVGLLLVPLFVLDMYRSLDIALFNAARRQRPMALWTVADAWARPAIAVLIVLLVGASATSVLSGFVLASAAVLLIFSLTTEREGTAAYSSDASNDRRDELLRYALPLLPLGLIAWSSSLADRYVIGGMLGLDNAGLYAAAYGLASRPAISLCGGVEATLRPLYFQAVSSGNKALMRQTFLTWLGLVTLSAAGIFLVFILFNETIAQWCLGARYRGSASLMPWIAAGYSFSAISHVYLGVSYAGRNTRNVLIVQLIGAIAALVLGFAGVYFFGLRGAAMAVVGAFGLQLAVAAAFAKRMMPEPDSAGAQS